MRVPFVWLKEYVELFERVEEVASELSLIGYPVDSISSVGAAVRGVLVGRVESIAPHPKADLMKVCQVDLGDEGAAQIVTTAANVRVGQKVAAAVQGAVLAGSVRIKRGKLRGVTSEGMLCSASELGLSLLDLSPAERHGLLEMPDWSEPGSDVLDVLGLDQQVIHLKPWPGRSPAGLLGLAGQLAVRLERTLEAPSLMPTEDLAASEWIACSQEAPCSGICAQVFRQVRVDAPPPWMARRLRAAGIQSVSNVVDLLRYVMMETGQPSDVLDLDRLELPLELRFSRAGERFGTGIDRDRTLGEGALVVADRRGPVSVAGVAVGRDFRVGRSTRNVLVVALELPAEVVRRNVRLAGVATEASQRFGAGLPAGGGELTLRRVAWLMQRLARGKPQGRQCWRAPVPENPVHQLDLSALEGSLGRLEAPWVEQALRVSGFRFLRVGAGPIQLPGSSPDQVSEELARLRGYDRIPACPPVFRPVPHPEPEVRRRLAWLGWSELVSPPASEDAWRGALEASRRVPRLEEGGIRLFEVKSGRLILLGVSSEGAYPILKGALEQLAEVAQTRLTFVPGGPTWLHPGRCARVTAGVTELGWVGELHPDAGVQGRSTALAQLDLERWSGRWRPRTLKDPRRDPCTERNLGVVVPEAVQVGRVAEVAQEAGGPLVVSVRCFDVYRGSPIPAGEKSLGLRVLLRTDRETEIRAALGRILAQLASQLGARSR